MQRIAKGSGLKIDEARAFMSEFQRMRTMMSRMSKMAGPGGAAGIDPALASAQGADMPAPGNRAARRASKKKKGKARGFGGGFG